MSPESGTKGTSEAITGKEEGDVRGKKGKLKKAPGEEERRRIRNRAILQSFVYLDPRHTIKNPVMFVVEVGSAITTFLFAQSLFGHGEASALFIGLISVWCSLS